MNDKVRYQVRGRALIDMVNALKNGTLVLSAHFQRKLVWRDLHKVDFIKTILLGYPFPEIFIARGGINVDDMTSLSCIVDGQQRMNAIKEYTQDRFAVDGKKYSEQPQGVREDILKYEIPVIELDMDKDDPQVIQIFKRLNRTFYALSQIEKISTEYASSYFMLIAKCICGEFRELSEDDSTVVRSQNIDPTLPERDPNISPEFVIWANSLSLEAIQTLLLDSDIFSPYEMSRQVHLMYTLNLLSTFQSGIYARNEQVIPHLDEFKDEFEERNELVNRMDEGARILINMDLDDYWYSKSNSFSLLVAIDSFRKEWTNINYKQLSERLNDFADSPDSAYAIAAKESVNNRKERFTRNEFISDIIKSTIGV